MCSRVFKSMILDRGTNTAVDFSDVNLMAHVYIYPTYFKNLSFSVQYTNLYSDISGTNSSINYWYMHQKLLILQSTKYQLLTLTTVTMCFNTSTDGHKVVTVIAMATAA